MLKMFASRSENIWARWKALIRPCGDNMNTRIPGRPRIAYSAALPVSPDVAPRILRRAPRSRSAHANNWPSSCIATSLNASVGPFESSSRCNSGPSATTGVIASLPNFSAV